MARRLSFCGRIRYIYAMFIYNAHQLTFEYVDEFLRLFVCVKHLDASEINKLEGKLTGLRDEGESITLKIVSLKDAWKLSPDAKLLSSLALYNALKHHIPI